MNHFRGLLGKKEMEDALERMWEAYRLTNNNRLIDDGVPFIDMSFNENDFISDSEQTGFYLLKEGRWLSSNHHGRFRPTLDLRERMRTRECWKDLI